VVVYEVSTRIVRTKCLFSRFVQSIAKLLSPVVQLCGHIWVALRGGTTRRLTNRCNGNLTRVFVWLRQASAPPQVPLISNVRRRRKIALDWMLFWLRKSDPQSAGIYNASRSQFGTPTALERLLGHKLFAAMNAPKRPISKNTPCHSRPTD